MNETGISWATHSWNPTTGCSRISEACDNCYAEKLAEKYQKRGVPGYQNGFAPTFHPERLAQRFPGKGKKIFVGSMSDLFHEDFLFSIRYSVIKKIKENPQHTFILCTKRPKQMRNVFSCYAVPTTGYITPLLEQQQEFASGAPDNCWLLTTAETQGRLNERLPWFLKCEARIRGLSLEPLLGPINFKEAYIKALGEEHHYCNKCSYFGRWDVKTLKCVHSCDYECWKNCKHELNCEKCGASNLIAMPDLHWVIIGCESGASRRPCKLEWVESVVEQCQAANVAVWVKQLDIGGKCVTDINKFPEHLRIREYPQ